MIKRTVVFLFALLLLSSCASREKIIYFQNISSVNSSESLNYEARFKPDDLLMIIVSAQDQQAAMPFNLVVTNLPTNSVTTPVDYASSQLRYQTYLVDNYGFIQFPVLGKIKIAGLTHSEAIITLTEQLKKYIAEPIINLRVINYKVSVIGEVLRPGTFDLQTERITLPEAISKAGDMTIYGNRKNVLVIREIDGKKTYNFVDMTKADFFNSPFYYLTQNDLVVVEPNKTKINSSAVGPNITVGLTALSLIVTIIALATK